jgi:HD-GYP domain-containing protein (c-di-GMP phosphodiesterase class II)
MQQSKRLSFLKTVSIVIMIYSVPLPFLSYIGVLPENNWQNVVLLLYGSSGLVLLLYINKIDRYHNKMLVFIMITSIFTFSSALITAPQDDFRVIWFFFVIFAGYFVGDSKIGTISSISVLLILFAYFFSDINTITTPTFVSMILSILIITQLSHFFSSIMRKNEDSIWNYKNNLELIIEEKLREIKDLNTEIISTQQEVIYTMGAIGESRSKETGNHVKRVAEYSYVLAKLYGLNEEEASILKLASPMHDIGKIGIKDEVLNKPGKLTEEEFALIKEHSLLGFGMLKHSDRVIFKTAAIVAEQHHERWDGKGYPRGLSKENIHIYGRITAIADVFDALGSDRVYKKAWKDDKIFKLIKEERAQQFDPKLVDIFFDNIDIILNIRDKFTD